MERDTMTIEEITADDQKALEEMEAADNAPEAEADPVEEQPEQADEQAADETPAESEKPAEPAPVVPEGMVPHQAMHAERARRQAAEAELARLKEAAEAAEKDKAPEWVDPLVDPAGFKAYEDHRMAEVRQMVEQQQAAQAQALEMQRRSDMANAFEAEFAKTNPEYFDAMDYLLATRRNELLGMGYDEPQIAMQIAHDANAAFEAGAQLDMNPAELLFLRAQKAGWKAPAAPDESAKMAALAKAQQETQGLGSTGGKQAGGLTLAQLAEMDEDALSKISEADLAKVLGG